MTGEFPDLYQALLEYPNGGEGFENRFYWIKQETAGNPVFSLDHNLCMPGEDFPVI